MRDSLWPAVFLAAIAGFVDALGYLALGRIFTAHMSGNSAAAGAHLGAGQWSDVLLRGMPIPAFVLGVILGATVVEMTAHFQWPMRLAPAFTVEIIALLVFFVLARRSPPPSAPNARFFGLLSLLALAMGVQSASLRRTGGERIRTTFISGMLTSMGEEFVAFLIGDTREGGRRKRRPPAHAAMFGAIFVAFMLGATAGGYGEAHWGVTALIVPITALVLIVADDVLTAGAHHGGRFHPDRQP